MTATYSLERRKEILREARALLAEQQEPVAVEWPTAEQQAQREWERKFHAGDYSTVMAWIRATEDEYRDDEPPPAVPEPPARRRLTDYQRAKLQQAAASSRAGATEPFSYRTTEILAGRERTRGNSFPKGE